MGSQDSPRAAMESEIDLVYRQESKTSNKSPIRRRKVVAESGPNDQQVRDLTPKLIKFRDANKDTVSRDATVEEHSYSKRGRRDNSNENTQSRGREKENSQRE